MTTGERIRAARLRAGLSQKELAQRVGVQFSAIHKYESGKVVNLKRDTIAALANALNVSPAWLMCMDDGEEDEMASILAQLRTREDMRMLFKLAKNATPEDVMQAVKIIEALRK